MKKIKKIFAAVLALLILAPAGVMAKRHAVKTHTRQYKSGKVVRVSRHTKTTKNK